MKALQILSGGWPKDFGAHPSYMPSLKSYRRNWRKEISRNKGVLPVRHPFAATCHLKDLFNPLHPSVYIIPRNRPLEVLDDYEDNIGILRTSLSFSSTDFYANEDLEGSVFKELYENNYFWRLGGIHQLGQLVPGRPDNLDPRVQISYLIPMFPHTRFMHCWLVAIFAEILLARYGFSQEERNPIVLGIACHDIAMPAGGDSIKRIDRKNLDEEDSFLWFLDHSGLDEKWKKQFNFDAKAAESWIKGEGEFGRFLDVLDKISYTALDCYYLGGVSNGNVRRSCLENPLVMDIWQDVRIKDEKVFFVDPDRLFNFLLLRGYEHTDLLLNPYSRVVDFYLEHLVRPLYEQGKITREQLLSNNDSWLYQQLETHYPGEVKYLFEPEIFGWRTFKTAKKRDGFAGKLGDKFYCKEDIKPFKTGLDWLVEHKGELVPLCGLLPSDKIATLEGLSKSVAGFKVYYKKSRTV